MKLYHFTSLESFFKIWVSKQLLFSKPERLNDSFERLKYIDSSSPESLEHYLNKSFNKYFNILSEYKQISFSLDSYEEEGFKSPMMWGHYAHNNNGVCIELDYEKLPNLNKAFSGKVKYDYKVPCLPFDKRMISDESDIQEFIDINQHVLFFIKHKHWEHENEYRIISRDMKSLNIADAITRIYVYDKSSVNTSVVQYLVKNEVEVHFLTVTPKNDGRYISSVRL